MMEDQPPKPRTLMMAAGLLTAPGLDRMLLQQRDAQVIRPAAQPMSVSTSSMSRRERRRIGITARQQRIRRQGTYGAPWAQERKCERILNNFPPKNRAERRFLAAYGCKAEAVR
jgi:hypothetical protein